MCEFAEEWREKYPGGRDCAHPGDGVAMLWLDYCDECKRAYPMRLPTPEDFRKIEKLMIMKGALVTEDTPNPVMALLGEMIAMADGIYVPVKRKTMRLDDEE